MLQINFAVLIVVVLVVTVSSAPVNDVQINSYNFKSLNDQNEYSFNYKLSDGQARDETGSFKNDGNGEAKYVVSGSYQYIGPDNVEYTVFYMADENGFHPFGTHLPGSSSLGIRPTEPPPALALPPNAIASLIG